MTSTILALSPSKKRDLWTHLLPQNSLQEQAAFLFCKRRTIDDRSVFTPVEMALLEPDDFAAQQDDYLELTDACRIRLIKRAHSLGASLVELHSHPRSQKISFSRSDRIGLQETVSHMRWRLKNCPYIAVVVGPCGFDALVWTDQSTVPGPLAGIRVGTALYEPTNASLDGWGILDDRFDRNQRLFGKEGQRRLRCTRVAVVGVGGLGTHVVQQLTLLGVGSLFLIDHEEVSQSNRNRYVGVWHGDPIPGSSKADLGRRLANLIDPSIGVSVIRGKFPSPPALTALLQADYVFGCVDSDGVRFVLNEACLAYRKPLFDLASDVPEPGCYGGRVCFIEDNGCLQCRDVLDANEVRQFLSPPSARENEKAVYGIDRRALDEVGPSVVSVNGVVASLGVTEFMAAVTGIREPHPHLEYRGDHGTVNRRRQLPERDCYCCNCVKGQGDAANLDRYYSIGSGY